jgi:putative DNA primase/helicase
MGDHGFVQNHATMLDVATWKAEGDAINARPVDPAVIQRQRDAERQRRIDGMKKARALWAGAHPMKRLHPYIEAKGLSAQGCAALRVADNVMLLVDGERRVFDEVLLVPMWQGRHLLNVQQILPSGEKRFVYGAPTKGGSLVLDRPRAALTALVEGLATGLAVYQCLRQARVIVAFNTGNLIPVVQLLQPSGSVVMCGDDDRGTFARRGINPGREAARNVADLIGCGVAFPVDIEGTDFADQLKEHGPAGARQMERQILAQARYVSPRVAA